MKTPCNLFLLAMVLFLSSQISVAQEVMVYQEPESSGQMVFTPQTGANPNQPVFVTSDGGMVATPSTAASVAPARVGAQNGTVFGAGTGVFDIGFDYLKPYWSFRDFTLAVPTNAAGNFILGDTGNVDNQFAFAPTVRYNYVVTDTGLGISASGKFLGLSGRLQRQLTTPAGTGTLTANSNLTIITANLPEATQRLYFDEFFEGGKKHKEWMEDLVLDLSIGSRYSSISQTYNSTLASSPNQSQSSSDQLFRGIGITGSGCLYVPFSESFVGYGSMRGSVLVGDNNRTSTLSVSVLTNPAASTTATINESATAFIPIGEIEMGIMWGKQLRTALFGGPTAPFFRLKAGGVAQVWGDVGPLSAGSSQGFRQSDLFLIGLTIVGQLEY